MQWMTSAGGTVVDPAAAAAAVEQGVESAGGAATAAAVQGVESAGGTAAAAVVAEAHTETAPDHASAVHPSYA